MIWELISYSKHISTKADLSFKPMFQVTESGDFILQIVGVLFTRMCP